MEMAPLQLHCKIKEAEVVPRIFTVFFSIGREHGSGLGQKFLAKSSTAKNIKSVKQSEREIEKLMLERPGKRPFINRQSLVKTP